MKKVLPFARFSYILILILGIAGFLKIQPHLLGISLNLNRVKVLRLLFDDRGIDRDWMVQEVLRLEDFKTVGILKFWGGDYQQAAHMFQRAVELSPGERGSHFFLGQAYSELGYTNNAFQEWNLAGGKYVANYYSLLAAQATDASDIPQAVKNASIAIFLDPSSGESYYQLGRAYAKQAAWQGALQSYQSAASFSKDKALTAKCYRGIGKAYAALGDHAAAAESLEQAIRLTPSALSYYLHLELAEEYRIVGDFEQAEAQIKTALQIDEEEATAYIRMGELFQLQGQKDQARDWIQRSIDAEPSSGHGEYALGRFWLAEGDYEQASAYLEKAFQLGWVSPWLWIDLAQAYQQTNQWGKAVSAYRQVIEMQEDPNVSLKSWIALAQIYTRFNDNTQAGDAWLHVLEIDPQNELALKALGKEP